MKKNLWIKLVSVILILASMVTLIACESAEDESWSDSSDNAFGGSSIRAEDLTPSQNLTFALTTDKKGYQLKSAAKCTDEQVVIPSTYTGTDGKALPVTLIAANAFKENKTAVTVYIPDSVTKISNNAFLEAKSLTYVICGSGITDIGKKAFFNCAQIKRVELKEGIKTIGDYAFAGCENLEMIVIPDSVKTIGEACFQRCARMTSVTLGKGLDKTVYKKNSKGVEQPQGGLGQFAFYFCRNISTIKYTGTKAEFEALHIDVSCFLSTTFTDHAICADGQKAEIPKLEGQNVIERETASSFD